MRRYRRYDWLRPLPRSPHGRRVLALAMVGLLVAIAAQHLLMPAAQSSASEGSSIETSIADGASEPSGVAPAKKATQDFAFYRLLPQGMDSLPHPSLPPSWGDWPPEPLPSAVRIMQGLTDDEAIAWVHRLAREGFIARAQAVNNSNGDVLMEIWVQTEDSPEFRQMLLRLPSILTSGGASG